MKKVNFPYAGFWVSWHFQDVKAVEYEQYLSNKVVMSGVYVDLEYLLRVLFKYELLIPTYVITDPYQKIHIEGATFEKTIETLKELISLQKLTFEISVGGYGIVYDDKNQALIQENLILVNNFRFFQRGFNISTTKSLWVPISLDDTYQFNWQIQLARNNCPRLEASLREIKAALEIEMYPAEDEIDRDNPIWIKGYKPYINPSILLREYQKNPPLEPFDLQEFLIDEQSNKPKP